jgi:hypothetical protein
MRTLILTLALISLTSCVLVSQQQSCSTFSQPVYRWFRGGNNANYDHLYTLDPKGELAVNSGYVSEGVRFYTLRQQLPGSTPLFRLFKADHTYTSDPDEKTEMMKAENGYKDEKNIGFIWMEPQLDTIPLYRYYNSTVQRMFLTTKLRGENLTGWEFDGILGWVYDKCQLKKPL